MTDDRSSFYNIIVEEAGHDIADSIIYRLDHEGWKITRKYPLLDRVVKPEVEMPWPTAPTTWQERMNARRNRGR